MLYIVVALVGVLCGVLGTLLSIGVLYRILLKTHVETILTTYDLILKLVEGSAVHLDTVAARFMDVSTREPPPLPSRSTSRTMWDSLEEKRRKQELSQASKEATQDVDESSD